MSAYEHGAHCAKLGYSIHYNQYRHSGTPEQYVEWDNGWKSVK